MKFDSQFFLAGASVLAVLFFVHGDWALLIVPILLMIAGIARHDLERARELLQQHGNYDWLTSSGKLVVLNNGTLGFVEMEMKASGFLDVGCELKNPNFAAMAEAVCALRHAFAALPEHDELGPSTITFGQIEGGYRPYVVPDRAKVWVDMRLTPPTDTAAATRMVEQAIAGAEAAVPGCHGSYTVTGDRPAIERDPTAAVRALGIELSAQKDRQTQAEPNPIGIEGTTMSSKANPIGIEKQGEKIQSLSCVGIASKTTLKTAPEPRPRCERGRQIHADHAQAGADF